MPYTNHTNPDTAAEFGAIAEQYAEWHVEEIPSLADLSIDDARSFIDAILEFYLHERGLTIVIDPEEADPKYKD